MAKRGSPKRPDQPTLWLVTDEDAATDVAPPSEAEQAAEQLPAAIDDLLVLFSGLDGMDPLEVDMVAASVAFGFRFAVGDPAAVGPPSSIEAIRSIPDIDHVTATGAELVRVVAQEAASGRPYTLEALHALAVYGGPLKAAAAARVIELDDKPHAHFRWVGQARIEAAHLTSYTFGDVAELTFELSYPDVDSRFGYMLSCEMFDGPVAVCSAAFSDLPGLLAEMEVDPEGAVITTMPIDEALGMAASALWIFDRTIGGSAELDEEDELDEQDLLLHRPLIDHLLASQPHVEFERPVLSAGEHQAAVADFVAWVDAEEPAMATIAADLADLLIDYAADRAGAIHRWTPIVIVRFLEFGAKNVMAPPEMLAKLPDLVRLVVGWSHARNAWPPEVTQEAHSAIDLVVPFFEDELGFRQLDERDQNHLDVSHPEPFDPSGIPVERQERAATIAKEAAAAATEVFDPEFATLVHRLTADAARHPDGLLDRGKTSIWASAIVYAVAQLNKIPGGWSPLAMPSPELIGQLVGSTASITSKATTLRRALEIDTYPPLPRFQHSVTSSSASSSLSALMSALAFPAPMGLPNLQLAGLPTRPEVAPVDPATIDGECFVLRVSLLGMRPEIWRRVRLPIGATFAQLHELLQFTFGWENYHLHNFDLDGLTIGPSMGPGDDLQDDADEVDVRLCDVLTGGLEFVYHYDFGDSWEHLIVVEGTEDVADRSEMGPWALLQGAMACPPEDCGGVWGYSELLKAQKDKNHPRRAELAEWLPPGFNSKYFDVTSVNQAVQNQNWMP